MVLIGAGKSRHMLEGDFRRQLQKGIEAQSCWAYKIPDLARGQIKPCDLVVGHRKRLFLIELKLRKLNRQRPIGLADGVISRGDFRPHQLPSLRGVETRGQATGCIAVCMVNETQVGWKKAWMLPVEALDRQESYALGELLLPEWLPYQLQWAPNIGWQVNWEVWTQ
jgi:hypothetical protein